MKLSGFVTINGSREQINWTLSASGIVAGPGLSADEMSLEIPLPEVQEVEEIEYTDGYDELTVSVLRGMLEAREEPIYGNKADLVSRLRGWDATHPEGYTAPLEEGEVVGDESDVETE
jgi:hypothetical protein